MLQGADDLSGAIRSAWIAAIATTVVVALVAYLVAGWLGAGLAAFALDRAPMAFLGSSLPRLALITLVLAVLVLVLGPVGVWGLVGLLGTHLAQVGAVLNAAWRAARR
jgi:hypothetical protein